MDHANKGNEKGRKFHNHKQQERISSPSTDQKKKKDISHMQCFKCKTYDHYARNCRISNKRKNEASITGVNEDSPHKKSRNDDCLEFFF